MSKRAVTRHCEKLELRRSREDRECFTWTERDGADEPQCMRVIGVGEQYLASTIFPGHESGFADAGWTRRLVWSDAEKRYVWRRAEIPARPITSAFCLPCCERWGNLRDALVEMGAA